MKKKLWHNSLEYPKENSQIIIVHNYWKREKDDIEIGYYKGYSKSIYGNNYNEYLSLNYPSEVKWDDWRWIIKKWCYTEDLLKYA